MAVTGRKPKEEGQKVNRNPATHDWVEVPDVPYSGDVPDIGKVPKATARWWEAVSTMPHCILWSPADWQFAVDTAKVHVYFSKGDMARAGELRVREKQMGTTMDARRDLRIRYVSATQEQGSEGGGVSDFEAERRRRLINAE